MPENWNYQYLNILSHQGKRFKVPCLASNRMAASEWCARNDVKHEFADSNTSDDPAFYFFNEKDAIIFKLRWYGA